MKFSGRATDEEIITQKLILVKHSQPTLVKSAPAHEWRLSPQGKRNCQFLAKELADYAPATIFSSQEPKALEIRSENGLSFRPCAGIPCFCAGTREIPAYAGMTC